MHIKSKERKNSKEGKQSYAFHIKKKKFRHARKAIQSWHK